MSKSEGPSINIKDKLPENREKADLMQHEVAMKAPEDEDASDAKHEVSMHALSNAKDRFALTLFNSKID